MRIIWRGGVSVKILQVRIVRDLPGVVHRYMKVLKCICKYLNIYMWSLFDHSVRFDLDRTGQILTRSGNYTKAHKDRVSIYMRAAYYLVWLGLQILTGEWEKGNI